MRLVISRPVWLVAMTALLTVVLVGCARTDAVMPFKEDPVEALCWRVVPQIAEFQDAISRSGTGDPEVVVNQATTAAKHVVTVIEIARRQDAEFSDFEWEWIDGLDVAAQAYVAISQGGLADLTDEEALLALTRIDLWFQHAADQCVGTTA